MQYLHPHANSFCKVVIHHRALFCVCPSKMTVKYAPFLPLALWVRGQFWRIILPLQNAILKCNHVIFLPEQVFGSGPQHQLLVDLHVELGPLRLQLAPACRSSRIGALKNEHKKGLFLERGIKEMKHLEQI